MSLILFFPGNFMNTPPSKWLSFFHITFTFFLEDFEIQFPPFENEAKCIEIPMYFASFSKGKKQNFRVF